MLYIDVCSFEKLAIFKDPESHPLAVDVRNQIIGGSVFGVVCIGGLTVYILIKKRIIKIKR